MILKKNIIRWKDYILYTATIIVVVISVVLGLHNATLYEPRHGFDGVGHLFYINYIFDHKNIPPVNLDWETHQSPLYYLLGAFLLGITKTWKSAQYMNTFILWGVISMVGVAIWRVFHKKDIVFLSILSLAALPMLNIFPPMITNELLSTFWMISLVTSCIYLLEAKTNKHFIIISTWTLFSFVMGYWTKVSIVIILPTVFVAYLLTLLDNKVQKKVSFITITLLILAATLLCMPVYQRAKTAEGPSNISKVINYKVAPRPLDFYYRLDWITKVDMYNAQYYSLIGGAWNSFWNDGHNAVTPFIVFHKKAFILWILGFLLAPISLFGLIKLYKPYRSVAILLYVLDGSMFAFYIYYNMLSGHYSAARLTYEMAIVVPYAFGLAMAYKQNSLNKFIPLLLSVQFAVMISFFWILNWWHVTQK